MVNRGLYPLNKQSQTGFAMLPIEQTKREKLAHYSRSIITALISAEMKIHAAEQCYAGAGSLNQIAERFGVHRSTLQKRLMNYDLFGEEGLRHRVGNHHYPAIGL
ncbi:helix-turn-helix domain-containing protein [uncultured Oscillibacter sp.]|uniref:helix-turn-helix domain-containing protein n=1 Tax=uncultured Oscillibacter sp. TaxID=876091 RepID=UPI0026E474F7|nr:helix-turn-helix domain-containing protein [uncultured Oscillibacter sp.]